jgi:hypothetical protein
MLNIRSSFDQTLSPPDDVRLRQWRFAGGVAIAFGHNGD